jgi:hypothetical protein
MTGRPHTAPLRRWESPQPDVEVHGESNRPSWAAGMTLAPSPPPRGVPAPDVELARTDVLTRVTPSRRIIAGNSWKGPYSAHPHATARHGVLPDTNRVAILLAAKEMCPDGPGRSRRAGRLDGIEKKVKALTLEIKAIIKEMRLPADESPWRRTVVAARIMADVGDCRMYRVLDISATTQIRSAPAPTANRAIGGTDVEAVGAHAATAFQVRHRRAWGTGSWATCRSPVAMARSASRRQPASTGNASPLG